MSLCYLDITLLYLFLIFNFYLLISVLSQCLYTFILLAASSLNACAIKHAHTELIGCDKFFTVR